MLNWLNSNATIVSALASAVGAFTALVVMSLTIVTVRLNRGLARENRELRKAEGDPRVVGYARINPRVFGAIEFVIANIGKGPAKNISYRVISDEQILKDKGLQLLPRNVPFTFLPAGESLGASLGFGWDLYEKPRLDRFDVEITFENLKSEQQTARYTVDVAQFDGMGRLGKPSDELMVENLKRIADAMEGWSMRRLQVETMSVTERAELDAKLMKRMEEQRAKRGAASPEQT